MFSYYLFYYYYSKHITEVDLLDFEINAGNSTWPRSSASYRPRQLIKNPNKMRICCGSQADLDVKIIIIVFAHIIELTYIWTLKKKYSEKITFS